MAQPALESTRDSVRVLIAADDDVLSEWASLKLAAHVPTNMPVKPYIERLLSSRLKWEDMDGLRVVTATGSTVNDLAPTTTLLQMNLTPRQLEWEPNTHSWAWLQKASKFDEPLLTPAQAIKARLQKYFEYYCPEKTDQDAAALMQDYDGHYDLMFLQLTGVYGPEPTPDMLYRKRITPSRTAKAGKRSLPETGQSASVPTQAPTGTAVEFDPSAMQDFSGIAMLMGRSSGHLLNLTYLRKWVAWARQRRESRRIVDFMRGNFDNFLRNQSYNRWKRFSEINKTRRQLAVSTKLAFKQESVVGGLAEENATLKEELRKRHAQVEVLESNNNRRLEALFSSSETAIIQMKLLTSELNAKERTISNLEQKLLAVGNKMLTATEERDAALARVAMLENDRDVQVATLTRRLEEMEAEAMLARERLEKMRPRTPPDVCRHCPHYTLLVSETDALKAHSKTLLERLDASEAARRELDAKLTEVQGQLASTVQSPPGVERQTHDPEYRSPRRSMDQRHDTTSPPAPDDPQTDSAVRNVSFALPPPARQAEAPRAISPQQRALVPERASAEPSSLPPRSSREVSLSMTNFFQQEDRVGSERVRMSLDRQASHRYGPRSSTAANRGAPPLPSSTGSVAPLGLGRYRLAENSLATAATMPGMPGTSTAAASHQERVPTTAMQRALDEPLALRPRANPLHHHFETGPAADVHTMRRQLFAFPDSRTGT